MTRRQFALERNGPSRVEVTWVDNFDEVRVFLDGALVHTFAGLPSFERGAAVLLPDGTTLDVRSRRWIGIDLRRNGLPLPGSTTDPLFALATAAKTMLWMGGIELAFDVERVVRFDAEDARAYAELQVLGDLVFIALAVLIKRGSRWPLMIAIAMKLMAAVLRYESGGALVSTIFDLAVAALLWHWFASSSGAPPPVAATQDAKASAPRRKLNATGWPTRGEDEDR